MTKTALTPLGEWALSRCGVAIHSKAVCMRPPNHKGRHSKEIAPRTLRKYAKAA